MVCWGEKEFQASNPQKKISQHLQDHYPLRRYIVGPIKLCESVIPQGLIGPFLQLLRPGCYRYPPWGRDLFHRRSSSERNHGPRSAATQTGPIRWGPICVQQWPRTGLTCWDGFAYTDWRCGRHSRCHVPGLEQLPMKAEAGPPKPGFTALPSFWQVPKRPAERCEQHGTTLQFSLKVGPVLATHSFSFEFHVTSNPHISPNMTKPNHRVQPPKHWYHWCAVTHLWPFYSTTSYFKMGLWRPQRA